MPAPTEALIETELIQQFIAQGLTKKVYDSDGIPQDSGELTDDQKKVLKALSIAVANVWQKWQLSQSVVAFDTFTSAPVVGQPGVALP